MSNILIDAINIQYFRGIRECELSVEGKNLIIKGENGTGKSSIVDSLDFFFTGGISYFEGKRELSQKRHVPHIDYDWKDVLTEVVFNPNKEKLTRTPSDIPAVPEYFVDYFDSALKGNIILRRNQILKFILDRPRDRFNALANIIGISELDEMELAITRLLKNYRNEKEGKENERRGVYDAISNLLDKNVVDEDSLVDELNVKFDILDMSRIKNLLELDEKIKEMLLNVGDIKDVDKIIRYKRLSSSIQRPVINFDIIKELKKLVTLIDKFLVDKNKKYELSLKNFLNSGFKFMTQVDLDYCPLCQQSIDSLSVMAILRGRIEKLASISDEASEIEQEIIRINVKISNYISQLNDVVYEITGIDELYQIKTKLLRVIDKFKKHHKNMEECKNLDQTIDIKSFSNDLELSFELLDEISNRLNSSIEGVETPTSMQVKVDLINNLYEINKHVSTIFLINNDIKHIVRCYDNLSIILSLFSEEKNNKVQDIYQSIKEDVNKYYTILHPEDPHFNIDLELDEKRRASTNLSITSFGEYSEDPKAYISEGHQDSLGLCIFLAFAKNFNGQCNLLVLDDVVTTIDSQHRQKICYLLDQNFQDYQLIITTHDEVWYEQIKRLCTNFKALEIISWSKKTGPMIRPYTSRWEKIEEKIGLSEKEGVGNASRQYAEWLLSQMGETIMARLPLRQSGLYTMNELMNAVISRIQRLVVDDPKKESILSELNYIQNTSFMANWLSHNNPVVSILSMNDVSEFAHSINRLNQSFSCPACGSLLKYYQDRKRICCPKAGCTSTYEIFCK